MVAVSAKLGHGCDDVRRWAMGKLPKGPAYYPKVGRNRVEGDGVWRILFWVLWVVSWESGCGNWDVGGSGGIVDVEGNDVGKLTYVVGMSCLIILSTFTYSHT